MDTLIHASRVDMQALAQAGQPLVQITPLVHFERLTQEVKALDIDAVVNWTARAELRPRSGAEPYVWLHLHASTSVLLACQRCLETVATPLLVDQWYRFVANEAIAMEQDDASDEDLLVMELQFDLLAVLEDELLMALPLVPMHTECPVAPALKVGEQDLMPADENGSVPRLTPHPFAALARLKKTNG